MSLPLFPLNTVLFPGCILDLQIFEARYLDMIGRCMKQGGGFGVVCILEAKEVGIAPAGLCAWSVVRRVSPIFSSRTTACWAFGLRAGGVSRCCAPRSSATS